MELSGLLCCNNTTEVRTKINEIFAHTPLLMETETRHSVFSGYCLELTAKIVENAVTRNSDYVSLLAAGLQYTALLSLKRTMRRGQGIPKENVKLMVAAAEKADIYLNRALHATSRAWRSPRSRGRPCLLGRTPGTCTPRA